MLSIGQLISEDLVQFALQIVVISLSSSVFGGRSLVVLIALFFTAANLLRHVLSSLLS